MYVCACVYIFLHVGYPRYLTTSDKLNASSDSYSHAEDLSRLAEIAAELAHLELFSAKRMSLGLRCGLKVPTYMLSFMCVAFERMPELQGVHARAMPGIRTNCCAI